MTDARTDILSRLRSEQALSLPLPEIQTRRFDWDQAERIARFQRMIEAVRAEVHLVADDWPARLATLLRNKGAGNLRYGPDGPLADALISGWPADGVRLIPHTAAIEDCREDLFGSTDAGFTACRAAIAETGSLVLWPTPAEPRLLSLVPPLHCVLLDAEQIVSTLHELMQLEHWSAGMPTNALLISGPSKSADIEQTLAYGVHGPAELIVLIRTASPDANTVRMHSAVEQA
jgi:L-lactate dehydrogenase complex protein LldG